MFSEANSLKSRSLSGKFTNAVSLLVRILDSENRFRSGVGVSQGQSQNRRQPLRATTRLRKQRRGEPSEFSCPTLLALSPSPQSLSSKDGDYVKKQNTFAEEKSLFVLLGGVI